MKGIVEQMREAKVHIIDGTFTQEDMENIKKYLDPASMKDGEIRKSRIKQADDNFKHLKKRAKELKKEIPFDLYWYSCDPTVTRYVGSDFMDKYKEWF